MYNQEHSSIQVTSFANCDVFVHILTLCLQENSGTITFNITLIIYTLYSAGIDTEIFELENSSAAQQGRLKFVGRQ